MCRTCDRAATGTGWLRRAGVKCPACTGFSRSPRHPAPSGASGLARQPSRELARFPCHVFQVQGCQVQGCQVQGCQVQGCQVQGCQVQGCQVPG